MNVLDRLLRAGIARHVAETHLRYGRVRVNGVPTTDGSIPLCPQDVVSLLATTTRVREV